MRLDKVRRSILKQHGIKSYTTPVRQPKPPPAPPKVWEFSNTPKTALMYRLEQAFHRPIEFLLWEGEVPSIKIQLGIHRTMVYRWRQMVCDWGKYPPSCEGCVWGDNHCMSRCAVCEELGLEAWKPIMPSVYMQYLDWENITQSVEKEFMEAHDPLAEAGT